MQRDFYVAMPAVALILIVQTSILPRFPIFGTVPNLLLVTTVAWALLRGQGPGLIWAFLAGLALDLFSVGPMGLAAATLVVTLFGVSLLHQNIPSNFLFSPLILGTVATVTTLLLQGVLLQLFGLTSFGVVARTLPVQSVANGIAILPIYWILFTALKALERGRIRLEA